MRRAAALHPLARRSAVLLALFRLYLRYLFWRRFHGVRLARSSALFAPAGRPLVIYCNHPSWWDPALLLLALPHLLPGRRGFGPMDAAELERYGLFRRMGLFGIEPGSAAGGRVFLRTALAGLRAPDACLCVTAEGSFTDPRLRPVRLRPGLAHLARLCPEALFVPLALEYGFWNESKPEALLRFGPPVHPPEGDGGWSVADWQRALQAGLTATMDALAAESATRKPAAFIQLFRGTAGVGGIYDAWRRLRALAHGQRFDVRHQPGRH
jgi:1-acyl-sn-glycerol-3-phosphate acyltransferase